METQMKMGLADGEGREWHGIFQPEAEVQIITNQQHFKSHTQIAKLSFKFDDFIVIKKFQEILIVKAIIMHK